LKIPLIGFNHRIPATQNRLRCHSLTLRGNFLRFQNDT
jgi:hypothetical protein